MPPPHGFIAGLWYMISLRFFVLEEMFALLFDGNIFLKAGGKDG
jgi:hypothetical protein